MSVFSASFHLFMWRARQVMEKVIKRFGLKKSFDISVYSINKKLSVQPQELDEKWGENTSLTKDTV